MMKKFSRSTRPHARPGHRARRLHLESLESRKLLASVITGMSATPVIEGSSTTLTVNFSEPATLGNTYRFSVDWGDGSGVQSIPFIPSVLNPATGAMQATFTHAYADDNATDSYAIRGAVIDSTMVSYWNFDEAAGATAVDFFGNNNGTLIGSAARVSPGLIGTGAANFNNAAGDAVDVGAGATFTVTNGVAIEALIRPNWDGTGYDEIFRKEDGNNRILFAFQNDPNNGGAQPAVAAGPVLSLGLGIGAPGSYAELDMPLNVDLSALSGGNANSGTIYLNPPGGVLGANDVVLKDGANHHIVGTYDVSTGVKAIYVDGVLRWSFSYAPGTAVNTGGPTTAYIGNTAGLGEPYTNVMDEVAFYNRGLTAQAVADHRAQTVAGSNYFYKTTNVTVTNAAPTVGTITGTDTLNEGSSANISVGFTDPGAGETYVATIDWGDGIFTLGTVNQATRTVTGSHVYANQGSFNVVVSVSDGTDIGNSAPFVVTVNNVLPVITNATVTTPINEGSSTNLAIKFTDPGNADVHFATIDWGDGSLAQTVNIAAGVRNAAASHVYANNGVFTVTYTINDGTGNSLPGSQTVTVNNVQPTIDAGAVITGDEGSSVSIAASFTDPGLLDTHVATIDWGDGSPVETINLPVGARVIPGSHVYTNNDSYTVTVTVTDGQSAVVSDTTTANIANVAPTVTIVGPDTTVRGKPTTYTFSADDPSIDDLAMPFTYIISWGDGTASETFEGPASGIEVVHAFPLVSPANTPFVISATATDADEETGDATEFEVTVVPFDVVFNDETGLSDLVVGGTQFADRIVFSMLYNGGLQIRLNSTFYRNVPDFDGKIIVFAGDGGDTIQVAGRVPYQLEIYGGNGNDYIAGGYDDDILDGGAGNDRLIDSRGSNTFYGGAGNDTISSGAGDDTAFGGDGNDRITSGFGDDVIDGEAGNDSLVASDGDDILFGGGGNDVLRGDRGNDIIDGGTGNDAIHGSNGRDILIGGRGADAIYGGVDDDLIVHSNVDFGNSESETEREDDIDALKEIQEFWLLPISLQERIVLIEGTLNESTIPDDNSRESIFGDADEDWYLIASLLELRRLQEGDEFTLLYV